MSKAKEDISKRKAVDPTQWKGELKAIGGSKNDDFNNVILNQAVRSAWLGHAADEAQQERLIDAGVGALIGLKPRDEIEGMIAAQLYAAHNAAMECYRRAMIPDQTFEGRRENLNQANKLSRSYAALVEALNRHRGKGQQKVTVEHVHVHAGGQAVVGAVAAHPGGGAEPKSEDQPHALGYAPGTEMRSPDPERNAVPITSDEEWPLPNARWKEPGSAEG